MFSIGVSTSSAKAIIYSSSQGIVMLKIKPMTRYKYVTTQEPEGDIGRCECGRSLLESFEGNIDAIALSSNWA